MLSFVERGQGPALVFLHAFPLDHSMWNGQLEFFSRHHRVIATDTFGFGASQPPKPWSMSDMGEALRQLLDHLHIERCSLAGLSMGGYIAIPFAIANPTRIEKLVLAHTRARGDTDIEKNNRNGMIQSLKDEGIEALPPRMVSRLLGSSAGTELGRDLTESILRASAEACIHAVTAMRDRLDQTQNLKRITCPTLVIAGPEDQIITVEDCRTMASTIPTGTLEVIANTGHLSSLEAPSAFNRSLVAFLTKRG